MIVPSGFERVPETRTTSVLRADLHTWLLPLLRAATDNSLSYDTQPLAGGRGGTVLVRVGEHAVVVRPYRRGGLLAHAVHDTYVGWRPRPFRELQVIEALRRAGAPVVEVYGACVRWLLPACYRGWIATRYIPEAQTLWEWARGAPAADARSLVLRRVGGAIRRLHRCGGRHPDLNLNNILICPPASAPTALFIDFDRPRLAFPFGHSPAADLARLERSARKLDGEGRYITAADLSALRAAYQENGG